MNQQTVLITERDRERLLSVLTRLRDWGDTPKHNLDGLAERLEWARVIDTGDIPRSVVTMNSLVGLRDLELSEKFQLHVELP